MKKKKKTCFKMRVTNAKGEMVTLKLPEKYRTYFDRAVSDRGYDEYDNSPEAMTRFFEEFFALDDAERELLQDIIACGVVNPLSIVDLTILAQSLDEYAVLNGISTPSELAEFYSYFAKRFEPNSFTAKMTENMYEGVGEEIVKKEKGRFFNGNYYFKLLNKTGNK